MITRIKTKNFMGQSIDEKLAPKTIYFGKNTVGKSMRAKAIALTICGFIPFAAKTNKKGLDILTDFGDGEKLVTSVVCNGVEFERKFSKSESGTVSQILRVDKKKYSKGDFGTELYKAGNPKVIDLNDFISLSDAKKIDTLFELYPPDMNISNLDSEIEKSKKRISKLQETVTTSNSVIKRLSESKNEIILPAGSLAETKTAIQKLGKLVIKAQNSLKEADIEEAKAIAVEGEKKKQAKIESEKKESGHKQKLSDPDPDPPHEYDSSFKIEPKPTEKEPEAIIADGQFVAKSIQRIIDTMKDAECATCAAMIVAKVELKKYKEGK